MRKIQVLSAIEDDFEQEEVLSENETPELLDIDESKPGELQPYSQYPQADKPEILVNDARLSGRRSKVGVIRCSQRLKSLHSKGFRDSILNP